MNKKNTKRLKKGFEIFLFDVTFFWLRLQKIKREKVSV
jgi:hypothetical protein